MCFSSGSSSQAVPPPNPSARFSYNQPVPARTQQQTAATNATTQPAPFGSELGSTGGY